MKHIKSLFALFAIAVLSISVAGCGSSSPKKTAEKYFQAIIDKDFDAYSACVDNPDKDEFMMMSELFLEYKIIEEINKAPNPTVIAEIKFKADRYGSVEKATYKVTFDKVDSKWVVIDFYEIRSAH